MSGTRIVVEGKKPIFKARSHLKQRQSVAATVIRACRNCGSPGVDDKGQPVGNICPTCGSVRPPDEDKGEVWVKERY